MLKRYIFGNFFKNFKYLNEDLFKFIQFKNVFIFLKIIITSPSSKMLFI